MNSTEVVVWFEGSCTTFGAPEMSLSSGFVHDDNTVDWGDPDDGIYWERACVYMSPDALGEGLPERPMVIDSRSGEAIASFSEVSLARAFAATCEEEGRPVEVAMRDEDVGSGELVVFHRRTRLMDGSELAFAKAVYVRGRLVLVRDGRAKTRCGLLDVTYEDGGDE